MEYIEAYLIRFAFLAVVAIPTVGFYMLPRRVREGRISKVKAVLFFSASTLLPTISFGGIFFGLVGLEEFTGHPNLSEGLGRSFLMVAGFGGLVWLLSTVLFLITTSFIKIDGTTARQGAAADSKQRGG